MITKKQIDGLSELDRWSQDLNAEFTLKNFLFCAVKLTKNPHPDKYSYSRYGIKFVSRSFLLFPNFDCGKNVVFSDLTIAHHFLLITRKKIYFLVKVQHKD